jgi:rhodanese-related sulfurtransferase
MKAATLLAKEGKEVYNLAGGITAWKEAGMPVEK